MRDILSSIYDNEITPNGYSVYRYDRSTRGGGVLFFVKSSLPSTISPTTFNVESNSVIISTHLIISCIYLPPAVDDSIHISLLAFLHNLSPSHNHIIMGDFNMPDIDWSTLSAISTYSNSFCDAVYDNNLYQLITVTTHIKGNTLDLLLTDTPDNVTDIHLSAPSLPVSDHLIISLSFTIVGHSFHLKSPRSSNSSSSHNYSQADWNGLLDHLCDIDFSTCLNSLHLDNSWDALLRVITDACDTFIPRHTSKSSNLPRWFTPHIKHLINKSRTIRKCLRLHAHNPSNFTFINLTATLNTIQEELDTEIAGAKENYIKSLLSTYNSNKSKLSLKSSHSIPHTVYYNDNQASDPIEQANLFNSFFNSTFSTSSFVAPFLNLPLPPDSPVVDEFGTDEVYKLLVALDTTKSQGPSGINPIVLKVCAAVLAPPLANFFTICINSASIPTQ